MKRNPRVPLVFSAAFLAFSMTFAAPQGVVAQDVPSSSPAQPTQSGTISGLDREAAALDWATVALIEAHTYSASTYENDLLRASQNFTGKGWEVDN